MTEIIVLDDDDDDTPACTASQLQLELTQEQRERATRNREIALVRRQAKEIELAKQRQNAEKHTQSTSFKIPGIRTSQNGEAGQLTSSRHQQGFWSISQPCSVLGKREPKFNEDFEHDSKRHRDDFPGTSQQQSAGFYQKPGGFLGFGPCLEDGEEPLSQRASRNVVRKRPAPRSSFGRQMPGSPEEYSGDVVAINPLTDEPEVFHYGEKVPELSEQQLQVLEAIRQGKSVFMTGSAGTGKSFLLKEVISCLRNIYHKDEVFVTASTGLAASEFGGTTVNAFAGVGKGIDRKETLLARVQDRRDASERWARAKALVVDEISMIDGEFFDKLEFVAREMKSSTERMSYGRGYGIRLQNRPARRWAFQKPWGGIQLVVAGDFFQLPPVKPQNPKKFFAFQAECWERCFHLQIELTQVFRQSDPDFVSMLNEIRQGNCSGATAQRLRTCNGPGDYSSTGVKSTQIYPHKKDVSCINDQRLNELGVPRVTFKAVDQMRNYNWQKQLNNSGVPAILELCVGAQVMLTKNLETSVGLVNGARGVVVGFSDANNQAAAVSQDLEGVPRGQWPIVRFICDGQERIVGPQSWSVTEANLEVAKRTQAVERLLAASRTLIEVHVSGVQVPLALAWALSVHKCQGMTLDRVETNLTNAFDCGMVYVALSRVKSLQGLRLTGFDPTKIKASNVVLKFNQEMGEKQREQTCL